MMWGNSRPATTCQAGSVYHCTVQAVRFYQCFGSIVSQDNFAMHPFAQIDLEIVSSSILKPSSYLPDESNNALIETDADQNKLLYNNILNINF